MRPFTIWRTNTNRLYAIDSETQEVYWLPDRRNDYPTFIERAIAEHDAVAYGQFLNWSTEERESERFLEIGDFPSYDERDKTYPDAQVWPVPDLAGEIER